MPELGPASRNSVGAATAGRVLCAIPVVYLLGIVAYAILNGADYLTALPQLIRYFVVPLALAGVFVWGALGDKGKRAATFGAYGCAILTALFLHEAVATSRLTRSVATNAAKLYDQSEMADAYFSTLPPGATARTLAARMDNPNLKSVLLGGLPGRETLLCTGDDDNPVAYRADRFGFNNPDHVYSAGYLDIAIFGDSFIEGMCLKPGDDVAARVRHTAPRTASFGFRGAGPLMELSALGRFGPALRPKLSVIVFYAGNDSENLEMELREPWLREALKPGADFGDAEVAPAEIDAVDGVIDSLWQEDDDGLARYRARVWRNFLALSQTWAAVGLHYPAVAKQQPEFQTIVARMRDIASTWGGELLFIYVPRADRFKGGLTNDFAFGQVRRQFFDAVKIENVDVIDLVGAFETDPDPLTFYAENGHFSPKGAAYLADLIVAYADDRYFDEGPEIADADADEEL
ncbi:MAG: hypothetical protein U5J99_09110 [Parvularculaceae bacterium]|nr:hypothetical protein [Parvularculaceae bacterium]